MVFVFLKFSKNDEFSFKHYLLEKEDIIIGCAGLK